MSSTSSRSCSTAAASAPGTGSGPPSAAESSTMIPSWSSPSPSSRAEQIIPSETCPYVFRAAMANPPGSTAPGSETTTRSPTAKLWAPQTTPREAGTFRPAPSVAAGSLCSAPTSTRHQRMTLPFFCGSSTYDSTRPTTSGPLTSAPACSTVSTSRPARISCSASPRPSISSGSAA